MTMQERSMRSVFVGNIPYEATEEQLKEIFSEAGPVISFRLVYDRENGKPKGYGFCEYRDADTALSAMRNLNGYELNGRAIRVDTAASEKNKEELKNLQMSLNGPPSESPYGIECDPERAPEVISRAVASLPPEQMYELMKQMKHCIQNNPNEARNMLLQNPQLAYALLQAQVAMKIIEPQTAMTMLHRPNPEIKPLVPVVSGNFDGMPLPNQMNPAPPSGMGIGPPSGPMLLPRNNFGDGPPFGGMGPGPAGPNFPRNSLLGARPPLGVEGRPIAGGFDGKGPYPREFDVRDQIEGDRGPAAGGMPMRGPDPRNQREMRDPRMGPQDQEMHPVPFDSRPRINEPRVPRDFDQRASSAQFEPRDSGPQDRPPFPSRSPMYDDRQGLSGRPVPITPAVAAAAAASRPSPDNEKTALIMQVLQLSDEQIALLPPEQRQSIMVLKEQIARSSQS